MQTSAAAKTTAVPAFVNRVRSSVLRSTLGNSGGVDSALSTEVLYGGVSLGQLSEQDAVLVSPRTSPTVGSLHFLALPRLHAPQSIALLKQLCLQRGNRRIASVIIPSMWAARRTPTATAARTVPLRHVPVVDVHSACRSWRSWRSCTDAPTFRCRGRDNQLETIDTLSCNEVRFSFSGFCSAPCVLHLTPGFNSCVLMSGGSIDSGFQVSFNSGLLARLVLKATRQLLSLPLQLFAAAVRFRQGCLQPLRVLLERRAVHRQSVRLPLQLRFEQLHLLLTRLRLRFQFTNGVRVLHHKALRRGCLPLAVGAKTHGNVHFALQRFRHHLRLSRALNVRRQNSFHLLLEYRCAVICLRRCLLGRPGVRRSGAQLFVVALCGGARALNLLVQLRCECVSSRG